ncbi:BatA domain-containing protein [Aquimarina sp. U1-2]|uniref:BatA domain-containing protein n=1 Tax=Aquimarina sp. U1-2 TaxID=2823141 RepID=UPI001AECD634|nr:BatA domain-containing protein [Aquimarina sp. U1-2]MBP2834004.1 BatA domain-containing protein [Aquimarina sp. U1-2]
MIFLNSIYLWALLGIILPVFIHLWSKKKGKTIKIGSIKLFNETTSRKSRHIQLHEWFLLLLRAALVGLLALILASPRLKTKIENDPITYIVESSVLGNERVRTILDTVTTQEPIRLLTSGLPKLKTEDFSKLYQSNMPISGANKEYFETEWYWQLAKEMETLHTDSIVVFTNAFLSGVRGIRPRIHKNSTWIPISPTKLKKKVVKATAHDNKIELLSQYSNGQLLTFEKEFKSKTDFKYQINATKDSIAIPSEEKQELLPLFSKKQIDVLLYDPDHLPNQSTYIHASLKALSKYVKIPIAMRSIKQSDTIDLSKADLMFWLSKEKLPEKAKKVIIYRPDEFASRTIEPGFTNTQFYLSKLLTAANIVEENFAEQLLDVFELHQDIENKVVQHDKRTIAIEELQPVYGTSKIKNDTSITMDISKWFWVVFVFLFIVERITAKLRKQ